MRANKDGATSEKICRCELRKKNDWATSEKSWVARFMKKKLRRRDLRNTDGADGIFILALILRKE